MNKYIDRGIHFLMLAVAATLPFNIQVNGFFIILLSVCTLIKYFLEGKNQYSSKTFYLYLGLGAVLFVYKSTTILYSFNLKDGFFDLEKTISLLLFPLIFYINHKIIDVNKTLKVFSLSVFIFLSYHLLKLYFHNPLERVFFEEEDGFNLRRAFHMYYGVHPTYFSIYMVFSAIIALVMIDTKNRVIAFYWGFQALLLLFFVWIMGARMVIIATLVIALFMMIKHFKKELFVYYILGSIVLCLSLFTAYKFTPSIKNRFSEVIKTEKTPPFKNELMNSTNIRVAQLICTKEVISNQNLLFGEGIGDVQDILNSCYQNHHWASKLYQDNYNFHNQYTQYLVGLGVIGLFLYVLFGFIPLIWGLKNKNVVVYSIALLLLISSLTECVMSTQKGIVFFSFFICLLIQPTKLTP
jgi:O-antigen ligase